MARPSINISVTQFWPSSVILKPGASRKMPLPACRWPLLCKAACANCSRSGLMSDWKSLSSCASASTLASAPWGILAARLQSHAELGSILIAHETYSLVKDQIDVDELKPITVKGFAQPVRIYNIRGLDR